VKNNLENEKIENLRGEFRTENLENTSVEFKPGKDTMVYHFKLKDFSSKGFGILVRKDSKVLQHIKPGDELAMVYHPDTLESIPVTHHTRIKHISEPAPGEYHDHLLVGILILE
jgi:hypothetical protein